MMATTTDARLAVLRAIVARGEWTDIETIRADVGGTTQALLSHLTKLTVAGLVRRDIQPRHIKNGAGPRVLRRVYVYRASERGRQEAAAW